MIHYKNCWNCKYNSPQMYQDSVCTTPDLMKYRYDGIIKKIYPLCRDIKPKDGTQPCKYFKEGIVFKIKKVIGKVQAYFYKRKHPEKFI